MSINSISFWQQDQNFWNKSQQWSQSQAQSAALINVIGNAMTTLSGGLSSIANQTALNRVNNQLTAAVQDALNQITGNSSASDSTSGSGSSGSGAASSTSTTPSAILTTAATGTGTAPLTAGTPLLGLGFVPQGSFSVSDGTFTTTYSSTGSDTVGDLINAVNSDAPGNADVTAWLDASGHLVIASNNKTDTITVSGAYAAALGFGLSNSTFSPTTTGGASSSASTTSGSSSTTGSSSSASSSSSANASSGIAKNSALALQTTGTAEILLASSGVAGTLLNLLA